MSRLTDLLAQAKAKDAALGRELEKEFKILSARRSFGLNFERHRPENVELPGRPVRKGDKVRVLPARGHSSKGASDLWKVRGFKEANKLRFAVLEAIERDEEERTVAVGDLIVVAEFKDYIYPGLLKTGGINKGGSKPFHTVINGENFHALEALTYTHRGKVDAIYIDPPYNTGARDWKYNNDYVEGDDLYRHSKWLAMMERRLVVSKELLNPERSVMIVSIDAREYLRLGLLLEQTFPDARVQMISSIINPKGVSVVGGFRRADEYLFFVMLGVAAPERLPLSAEWSPSSIVSGAFSAEESSLALEEDQDRPKSEPGWTSMMRRGSEAARSDRPSMFYPIYANADTRTIIQVGDPIPDGEEIAPAIEGLVSILPIRRDGSPGRWQISAKELKERIKQGRIRLGRPTAYGFVVNYLPDGAYKAALSDAYQLQGRAADGSIVAHRKDSDDSRVAPTQWKIASHNASEHGSGLLEKFIPKRKFPFPKSLYAVEDSLRFFLADLPNGIVLDFFSGSGTTAHAVMRLNKQDGGRRQCISITNNEVAADEQESLRKALLRPGDGAWEKWGICEYITKPRIEAAITGKTPGGVAIPGDYGFTDVFPMKDGSRREF